MNPYYNQVALRAAHRCEYCHAPEVVFNFPFEVEHITPLARAGKNDESNMGLACRSCNLHKATHTTGINPRTQTVVRLFHPRTDQWHEHFVVNLANAEIFGLTEIGSATVERLEMNSEPQRIARQQWMRLGIFP